MYMRNIILPIFRHLCATPFHIRSARFGHNFRSVSVGTSTRESVRVSGGHVGLDDPFVCQFAGECGDFGVVG